MQQSQQSATAEAGKPVVSGYQLHSRLGEGGEGRVWLATHVESGARVALKILHRRIDGDDETLSRLERGFSALAELNCRGIAGAIGRGELSTGEAWQATAFVAGRNLIEEIARIKHAHRASNDGRPASTFPIRPVLELFERVCTAVDLAHRLGVIHRDLKSANIIVDEDGQPWLVDFGIAKKPSALDATIVTLPGHFVGSIQCASPEQVDGRPELIDHRADLYSLGVILYQLTTGKFPYNVNGSLSQIFDRIRFARPVEPSSIAPWMDRDLQAIILKSLEKEPLDRYSTAADMRDDIRRYLDGAPIMARNSGFATAAFKFAGRHRRASAVTAVVASLSIFYAISVTWLLQRATHAEATAAAQADAARAKFRMAQETAEEILTNIDQQLKDRPDTAELRRNLLKSAYDRFSILVAEKEHDPALLVDFAKAHTRMSDIALALGLLDDCEKHRKSALEIWKKLAESHPDDVAMKAQLSIAIVLVGDLEKVRGQTGPAEALYRESLAIDESLVQSHPYNAALANNLSWSYERVGAIVDSNCAAEKALPFHRKRHALCERLLAGDPSNPEHLFSLLASHTVLSNEALVGQDETDEHVRAAAILADRLMQIDANNDRFVHYYLLSRWNMSRLAGREGAREKVALCLEQAIEASQGLLRSQPNHILYNKLHSNALSQMARFHAEGDNWPESVTWQIESIPYMQAYCRSMPDNPEARFGLATVIGDLFAFVRKARPDEDRLSRAALLIEESLELLPANFTMPADFPSREVLENCRETLRMPSQAAR